MHATRPDSFYSKSFLIGPDLRMVGKGSALCMQWGVVSSLGLSLAGLIWAIWVSSAKEAWWVASRMSWLYVAWVQSADNKGGRWGKRKEQGDKEEGKCVRNSTCWLCIACVVLLGSGNLGVIMWSEMTNSEATACAHFIVLISETSPVTHSTLSLSMDPPSCFVWVSHVYADESMWLGCLQQVKHVCTSPYHPLICLLSPPSTAFPFPHLTHFPASCIALPLCPSSVPKKLGSPTSFASRQQQQCMLCLVICSLVIDNPCLLCPFLFYLLYLPHTTLLCHFLFPPSQWSKHKNCPCLSVKASTGLDSATCTKGKLVVSTWRSRESLVLLETTQSSLCKRWGKGEAQGELSRTLILQIKSSLGLDCWNTGCLYTGGSVHGPWSLR